MTRPDRAKATLHKDDVVMTHYRYDLPGFALCGVREIGHLVEFNVERDVDCMTCLVEINQPSLEDRMAMALGMPREFLYGPDDYAQDR